MRTPATPPLLLLLLLVLASLAAPAQAETIEPRPDAATAGADVVLALGGLKFEEGYRVDLVKLAALGESYVLDQLTGPADSAETLRVRIPAQATIGSWSLNLVATRSAAIVAQAPFQVEPGLSIGFNPDSAAPGERVEATVSGLRTGRLVLAYDGEVVLGPVPVAGGTWTGGFLVPQRARGGTAEVVATNYVGRNVVARGSAGLPTLASSTAPPYAISFSQAPPATVALGTAMTFAGRIQDRTGNAPVGRTSFFWRSDDGLRMVPIDGGVIMDAAGNFTLAGGRARAPSELMDGVPRMGSGELVAVVNGTDVHTGAGRDFVIETGHKVSDQIVPDEPTVLFTVRVVGRAADGTETPLRNVYLSLDPSVAQGFFDPATAAPPTTEWSLLGVQHQLSNIQGPLTQQFNWAGVIGCPTSFSQKLTGSDDSNRPGDADFAFDPELVNSLQILAATKDMGEIRVTSFGNPIPGIDVFSAGQGQTKRSGARKSDASASGASESGASAGAKEYGGDELYLSVRVSSGQQGHGPWDFGTQGDLTGIPLYRDEYLVLVFDGATRALFDAYPTENGREPSLVRIEGSVVTVSLGELPPDAGGVVPYNLRIKGLVPVAPETYGAGRFRFNGMDSFDPDHGWTEADITTPNAGREMRFAWESGFGIIQRATLTLQQPHGMPVYQTDFMLEGDSACNLSGVDDYKALLPDMTHWPANAEGDQPYCRLGVISVSAMGGRVGGTLFELCTRRPPETIRGDLVLTASRNIDALTNTYTGDLDIPAVSIVANDPKMAEYEVPPQNNAAASKGSFDIRTDAAGDWSEDLATATDHTIGNEAADIVAHAQGSFGFDGAATRSNIIRTSILDTGLIPLFRYPWGFSPIAGAVFGADLWMAASVAFYGQLDMHGDGGNLMNATIDPTLNGGVNVFFDLDVLFGVVSASVSAQPQIGLSIKEVIGNGGLAGDEAGACFGFDLDVAMEICAVLCHEDRFNVFKVRTDDDGNSCFVSMKQLGTGPGVGTAPWAIDPPLKLSAPSQFPSAMANAPGGAGLVLEATADATVVAHHMTGTDVDNTLTLAVNAHGVQHVAVEFLNNDTALAVWSQSTLSKAAIEAGMSQPDALRTFALELARKQALYWSLFNGQAWSAPQLVPSAALGSGKPKIASNLCDSFGCAPPASPVAYLVWEHDAAGNLSAPDMDVWGARFLPGTGFTHANRISSPTGRSDMQPDVAWVGTQPLVAWLSAQLPHLQNLAGRGIVYRIVDFPLGGGITNRLFHAPFPAGTGWPALAARGNEVVMAFTVAQDTSAVGNRLALHAAKGSCGIEACTWQYTEVRDPLGRQIRGERPQVALDADGGARILLRGLAYGPDAQGNVAMPADPMGMVIGSGDLVGVTVTDFSTPALQTGVQSLSNDGLQHWRPTMVFDPASDSFITIARVAAEPAVKSRAWDEVRAFTRHSPPAVLKSKALGGGGLVIGAVPAVPDLRVERLELGADYLVAAEVPVWVDVRNVGSAFKPELNGAMHLHAAWDAPPGVGVPAVDPVPLVGLGGGEGTSIQLNAKVPAGHAIDQRRTLFVEVRAQVPTEDASTGDNAAQVTVGALPVPYHVTTATKIDSPLVTLQWKVDPDPRVAGFRVYRRAENGEFVPYGSSDVPGYADLFAGLSNPEEYRVTSFSINGVESEPSGITLVIPTKTSGVFSDGFEPLDE